MSPILSNIFQNDLHDIFTDSEPIVLENISFNSISWADDLLLMSTSKEGLQRCIDDLHGYCAKWGLEVNASKTKSMELSKSHFVSENFRYGNADIECVKSIKYLGFSITYNHKFEIYNNIYIDGVRRGSAASRDRAADAVAPVPLGSQASAPGPDMVSQLNDDSPHTEGDDANETFTSPQRRRSQPEHLRQQADVILITDSTGKYVDSSGFMGRQNYTFHERASASDTVLRNLNRWPANDNVKFVILHNGVNDVRDGKTVSEIVDNLKSSLSTIKKLFTRAQEAYSEMLGSERSNPEQNEKVKDINRQIRQIWWWCSHQPRRRYCFIREWHS